jgi:hypothetical protein
LPPSRRCTTNRSSWARCPGVFPVVEPTNPDRFSADRYAVLTGQDSRTYLAPFEPDLVGEFFFLEHLHPRDAADDERALLVEILAWVLAPQAAFAFTTRCTP